MLVIGDGIDKLFTEWAARRTGCGNLPGYATVGIARRCGWDEKSSR